MDYWNLYGEYIKVLVVFVFGYLVSGGEPTGLVQLIQWAKIALHLDGKGAAVLKWALALVTAVALAWINGQLDFAEMTPAVFLGLLMTIAAGSEYWYRKLRDKGKLT